MRVRLTQPEHAAELTAYLRSKGFLVVDRGPRELDIHLVNHVSARSDSIEAGQALAAWRAQRPDRVVDEIG